MVAAWIKTFLFVLTLEVRPHYVVPVSNQPQVIFRALGTKGSSRVFPDQTRAFHTTWRGGPLPPVWGVILLRHLASFITTVASLFTTQPAFVSSA
jgi:hypothetical protein